MDNPTQITRIVSDLDPSKFNEGLRSQAVELDKFAEAADRASVRVEQSTTRSTRALLDQGRGMQRLARQFVDGYAEAETFSRAVRAVQTAIENGNDRLGQSALVLEGLRAKYGLVGDGARQLALAMNDGNRSVEERTRAFGLLIAEMDRARQSVERMSDAEARAARARAYNYAPADFATRGTLAQRTNLALGISGAPDPAAHATRQAGIEAAFADADALRARVDPIFARSRQYEEEWNTIQRLRKLGVFTLQQEDAALLALNRRYADHTDVTRRAGHAAAGFGHISAGVTQELIVLARELATGRMADFGASMLVLSGQVEVMRNGLASMMRVALNPFVLAAGAAVAGITAAGVAAESSAYRLGSLREQLSLVRGDYAAAARQADDAAKHLARTSPLSTDEARSGINEVFRQGLFRGTGADAERIVRLNERLSRALGETEINARRAGEVIADPAGVLAQILKERPENRSFDQRLVDEVRRMQEIGRQGDAVARALEAIERLVRNVPESVTPLRQAWHDLGNAFAASGQSGKSFLEALGGPILAGITETIERLARAVRAVSAGLGDAIEAMNRYNGGQGVPGLGALLRYGTPMGPLLSPFIPGGGGVGAGAGAAGGGRAIPGDIDAMLAAAARTTGLDPATLRQIYRQEAQVGPDGRYVTSSAGARGPMQIMPGTFASVAGRRGIAGGIDDPASNILAGAWYYREMLDRYRAFGPDIAAGAYNAGPGTMDRVLAGTGTLPAETARYIRTFQGAYSGAGYGMPGVPNVPTVVVTPGGGLAPNHRTDAQVVAAASPLAAGSVAGRREDIARQISDVTAALQLPGNSPETITKYIQALAELRRQLYEAVTPADALERSLRLQLSGQDRLAAAWARGAPAAARMTVAIQAEAEARRIAGGEGQAAYQLAVRLTDAYEREAAAAERVRLAEKSHDLAGQVRLMRAEAETIGMASDRREAYLGHLRNQMIAEREAAHQSPETRDAYVAQLDAVDAYRRGLDRLKAGMSEIETFAQGVGERITSALFDPLRQGETMGGRWRSFLGGLMNDLSKETFKLGVQNPLMNAIFGGKRPTMDSVGDAFGALVGGTNANGLPIDPVFNAMRVVIAGGPGSLVGGMDGEGGSQAGSVSSLASLFSGRSASGGGGGGGAAGGAAGGGDGIGGFLGRVANFLSPRGITNSLFGDGFYEGGGLLGSWFGGPSHGDLVNMTGATASGLGPALLTGSSGILAGGVHAGGIIGSDPWTFQRVVPHGIFAGAPRLHNGFIGADEFAAILQRGERVLTQPQQRAAVAAANSGNTFNVQVTGPMSSDAARRTGHQIASAAADEMERGRMRSQL